LARSLLSMSILDQLDGMGETEQRFQFITT
jgi:hypothetical protein